MPRPYPAMDFYVEKLTRMSSESGTDLSISKASQIPSECRKSCLKASILQYFCWACPLADRGAAVYKLGNPLPQILDPPLGASICHISAVCTGSRFPINTVFILTSTIYHRHDDNLTSCSCIQNRMVSPPLAKPV